MTTFIQTIQLEVNWVPLLSSWLVAFIVSFYLCQSGTKFGVDKETGIQKFHTRPTSRLGGVGIALGILCGVWVTASYFPSDALLGVWLILASLPVFFGGVLEDLTHRVTPRLRLVLACISSGCVYFVFRVGVTRTDIELLDYFLQIPGAAFLLTMLVVAGFINSVNIIDGFHGLASGTVIIMLCGLGMLAIITNDWLVLRLCLLVALATLGFAILNWPFGKIFLGDGGAYFLGLWVVVLGLLLPHRTTSISPMSPVLVGVYPLLETLFSMYRRKFVRSHPINHPDALHLHTLIYRRLILNPATDISDSDKNIANAKVAVIVWGFAFVPIVCACLFYSQTRVLLLLIIFFAYAYFMFYKLLVTFKAPSLLISKRRNTLVDNAKV